MKRSGLLRRSPLRRRGRRGRTAAEARRDVVMALRVRSKGLCEVGPTLYQAGIDRARTGLPHPGSEGHEPLTRARRGDPTDPAAALWTCRPCHEWAHRNPAKAEMLGLLVPSR